MLVHVEIPGMSLNLQDPLLRLTGIHPRQTGGPLFCQILTDFARGGRRANSTPGPARGKYSVTLFPNESCNCPATTRCCHIIAAIMSIGMPIPNDKKKINLAQLRWNMCPKHSKRCGTKKVEKGIQLTMQYFLPQIRL